MRKCILPVFLAVLLGGPPACLAQDEPSEPAVPAVAEPKPAPAAQPATPAASPFSAPSASPPAAPAVVPTPTPAVVPTPTPTVVPSPTPAVVPTPTSTVVPSPTPTALPPATAAIDSKREVMHKYEADRLKLRLDMDKMYRQNRRGLRDVIAKRQQRCQTLEAVVGRDQPVVVMLYSMLAMDYSRCGQNQTAAPLMKWCIDGGKKVFKEPEQKKLIPMMQLVLAKIYVDQSKYAEASALIKEALPKVEAMKGTEPAAKYSLGLAYVTQSRLAARDGNYERAVELLNRGKDLILGGKPPTKSGTPATVVK